MTLTDENLREIFSLFASCSDDERNQVYDKDSLHYYKEVKLDEVYDLSMGKRDYALDSWRAVLTFLKGQDIKLLIDEKVVSLDFVNNEYI